MAARRIPSPSIVIEWETARACSGERAVIGLSALCEQLWQLAERMQDAAEVVITHDPVENSQDALRSLVASAGGMRGWPIAVRIVPVPAGTDYYGHKNFGFLLTRNEVVVFLDSDLIPDAGWLEQMLEPLCNFRSSVVVGNTYIETTSLYSRCVALFWIFEPRCTTPVVRRTARLVSNSVAIRRALFSAFPFPIRPTFRGQCSELAATLRSKGISLFLNSAAQAAHPPPSGWLKFIERAVFAGHDECTYRRLDGPVRVREAFAQFGTDLRAVRRRIEARRRSVRSGPGTVLLAACLGIAYYTLKLTGFLWTLASPTAIRRAFQS